MKSIHRGDIYWAKLPDICGSIQRGTRPVIVISNNMCNIHSSAINVIPVTTKEDDLSLIHPRIHGTPKPSYAMCEQVMTVDIQMLEMFIVSVSDSDMKKIDAALLSQLDLPSSRSESMQPIISEKDKKYIEIGKQAMNLIQPCVKVESDYLASHEESALDHLSAKNSDNVDQSNASSHNIITWSKNQRKSQIDKFNERLEKCKEMNSNCANPTVKSVSDSIESSSSTCSRPLASKWTSSTIDKFIREVETAGIYEAASSYSLSIASARSYYSKFKKGKML